LGLFANVSKGHQSNCQDVKNIEERNLFFKLEIRALKSNLNILAHPNFILTTAKPVCHCFLIHLNNNNNNNNNSSNNNNNNALIFRNYLRLFSDLHAMLLNEPKYDEVSIFKVKNYSYLSQVFYRLGAI
jgi:hypothetical protein